MEKIIEHHPTWDVYNYWCWGNESAFVKSFKTKREAEAYIAAKGNPFKGFEGLNCRINRLKLNHLSHMTTKSSICIAYIHCLFFLE